MGSNEELEPLNTLQDYLTIAESATYLNKCHKTVLSYVRDGLLRARRFRGQGRKFWIKKDDVRAFKEVSEKKEFRMGDILDVLNSIQVRLNSLEHHNDYLMHISGLDISPLRTAKIAVLVMTYDEICDTLHAGLHGVDRSQMEEWARVFLQFTEIEYDRLVGPTMDAKPWKVFHQLCVGLMNTLRRKKGFSSHPKMQQAYRLLDKARKHIAQSALVFDEARSSQVGPRRAGELAAMGVREDPLDHYISTEARKTLLH